MTTRFLFCQLLPALTILSILSSCKSTDRSNTIEIAQWRGEHRTGVYDDTGLLNLWEANGLELLWAYEGIGKGYASPAVYNNTIFVNGEKDSTSVVFAIDLNGNLLWEASNGLEFMGEGFSATYPGARSTPTIVEQMVFATSGKGRIGCFETENGKELWAVGIIKELNGLENYFGYSESVLVDDGKVYCFPGGEQNNTVALDWKTGNTIWSVPAMRDTFSYCSPILVQLPEKKVLVTHSRHYLYTLDADNGQVLDSYFIEHYQYDGEHCNSPLYANGSIYFIGNEKEDGAIRLDLSADGKLTEVWKNTVIKNNFNGYVVYGNHLFTMVKGNKLLAINTATGAVDAEVKAATGSIIYADNKFICYGMNGDLNLVSFANNEFKVTGQAKVTRGTGQHFAHPVLANGVLLIRHGDALLAYKVS
ncbi:PQQ-binding-like beta-propeller repeat protein [uncultured Draconibacterium sp.]|uniref:PQQ-binding-like beta-propeller repeat protein n=1 Tax=uncultured Draconibacterium sp. TaxID=1573823 RepID=UPI003260F746